MKRTARPELLTPAEWRKAVKRGENAGVSLPVAGVFKAAKEGGPVSFIASTAAADRYGDVIEQAGWDLAAFKANPVLLWAHKYDQPPVGRCPGMVVENGNLVSGGVEFTPASANAFGAQVEELVRGGFLNTVSVGFLPKKWEYRADPDGNILGIRFLEQELLELSVVPVPANPEALAQQRSFFSAALKGLGEGSVAERQVRSALELSLKAAGDSCTCAAGCECCAAGSCGPECSCAAQCDTCKAGNCPHTAEKDASDFAAMLGLLETIEKNTLRAALAAERQDARLKAFLDGIATKAQAEQVAAEITKRFL